MTPKPYARVVSLFGVRGSGTSPEANLRVAVRRRRGAIYEAAVGTCFSHGLVWTEVLGLHATAAEATEALHRQYPGQLFPTRR